MTAQTRLYTLLLTSILFFFTTARVQASDENTAFDPSIYKCTSANDQSFDNGVVLNHAGFFNESALCFEYAIQFSPESAEAYAGLGISLAGWGFSTSNSEHVLDGLKQLGKAAEMAPDYEAAYYWMAVIARDIGEPKYAYQAATNLTRLEPQRSLYRFWLGVQFFEESNYEKAVAELRLALLEFSNEKDPRSPTENEIKTYLAHSVNNAGDGIEAVKIYEEILSADSSLANAWLGYGIALRDLRYLSNALIALNKASELTPKEFDRSELNYAYGILYWQLEDFESSRKYYTLALDQLTGVYKEDALFSLAVANRRLGNMVGAKKYLDALFVLNPQVHATTFEVLHWYALQGDAVAARKHLELTWPAESKTSQALMTHGELLFLLKDYRGAAEILKESGETSQVDFWTSLLRARALLASGDYVEANRIFKYLADQNPDSAIALLYFYEAQIETREFKKDENFIALAKNIATVFLTEANRSVTTSERLAVLVRILIDAEELKEAAAVLKLDPKLTESSPYLLYARALLRRAEKDESWSDDLKRAVKLNPHDIDINGSLVPVFIDEGNIKAALDAFRKSYKYMSPRKLAKSYTADIQNDASTVNYGIRLLAQLTSAFNDPDTVADAYLLRGLLLISISEREQASIFCKKALALNANDRLAYFLLGRSLQGLGKIDQAREIEPILRKLDPTFADVYVDQYDE